MTIVWEKVGLKHQRNSLLSTCIIKLTSASLIWSQASKKAIISWFSHQVDSCIHGNRVNSCTCRRWRSDDTCPGRRGQTHRDLRQQIYIIIMYYGTRYFYLAESTCRIRSKCTSIFCRKRKLKVFVWNNYCEKSMSLRAKRKNLAPSC